MSKFSDRLKRLHSSRVRATEAAERAQEERDSVYTADDVAETSLEPSRARTADAERTAWEAVGATLHDGWISMSRTHGPETGHGRFSIGQAADAKLSEISREVLGLFAKEVVLEDAVFVDIETAGLGDGPGNEAWCVGIGAFQERQFRVDHIMMSHPSEERAVLRETARRLAEASLVVTFNGATFDLPRLSAHFARHDIVDPIPGTDHIDLLRVARRLFPTSTQASLAQVEQRLLGFERRHDVPGSESPRRWSNYLRTLNVRPLLPLIEHNRLDIVSLAVMMAYLGETMAGERSQRPRVDRRVPARPPRSEWDSPEVRESRSPVAQQRDDSGDSDFRKKLVRSYRLKSKTSRPTTARKKVDRPRVASVPQRRPEPSASTEPSIGDRLSELRREAARLLESGDDASAVPVLHEMVALSPRNPFPLAELARYYREVGDDDLAQLFESRLNDVAPY